MQSSLSYKVTKYHSVVCDHDLHALLVHLIVWFSKFDVALLKKFWRP